MTTEVKKPEDGEEEVVNTEVDETELLDVISAAVDEVTPDDVLAANKETVEIEGGAEQTPEEKAAAEAAAAEQTPEEKAADEKAAAEKAAEEKAAAEAFEKLTPEEKAADEKAAAEKAAEEKVVADKKAAEEKAAAEAFEKLTPEEKAAAEKVADKKVADKKVAEEKAAEEKAAAEKADPINDPIPESTKAETATRIKALIEIAKDNTTRADQADEIVAQITDTGADPDQYANTLGFLRLYNSTDPVMRKQALTAAEGVVRELRIELGEGGVDLLDNHDDLKAEIEAGTLTEARAIEIANGREKTVLSAARTEAANTKTANDEQTAANIVTGKAQLTSLEATLVASDTEYARLRPTFIAMLKPALRKTHATEWGAVAQEIYVAVKKANPAATVAPVVVPKNTPLRPKGGGGGSADKETGPDTALAAVDAALSSM